MEALVVSVAEVWLPPPPRDEILDDTFPFQIPAGVKLVRERATRIVEQAQELAERRGELIIKGSRRIFANVAAISTCPRPL